MTRAPPRSTRTSTLFPYTPLFRSHAHVGAFGEPPAMQFAFLGGGDHEATIARPGDRDMRAFPAEPLGLLRFGLGPPQADAAVMRGHQPPALRVEGEPGHRAGVVIPGRDLPAGTIQQADPPAGRIGDLAFESIAVIGPHPLLHPLTHTRSRDVQ